MKSPERIYYRRQLLAVIIRGSVPVSTTTFYSPTLAPLQIGTISKKRGDIIRPHIHNEPVKTVRTTQEVLVIEKGKLLVDLYASNGKRVYQTTLSAGDKIFLVAGGHGFTVIQNTRIFEVKQGPYPGYDKAKKYLDKDRNHDTG